MAQVHEQMVQIAAMRSRSASPERRLPPPASGEAANTPEGVGLPTRRPVPQAPSDPSEFFRFTKGDAYPQPPTNAQFMHIGTPLSGARGSRPLFADSHPATMHATASGFSQERAGELFHQPTSGFAGGTFENVGSAASGRCETLSRSAHGVTPLHVRRFSAIRTLRKRWTSLCQRRWRDALPELQTSP